MWYNKSTNKIISNNEIRRLAYPSTLPKSITPESVKHLNIYPAIQTDKPDITVIQSIQQDDGEFIDGVYYQKWKITDRFKDEVRGLTKETQETEALNKHKQKKLEAFKTKLTLAVKSFVQSKIDDYNVANYTTFNDVIDCALFATVDGYKHRPFCIEIWAWNMLIWESVSDLLQQADNDTIATKNPADLITMLPAFSFDPIKDVH